MLLAFAFMMSMFENGEKPHAGALPKDTSKPPIAQTVIFPESFVKPLETKSQNQMPVSARDQLLANQAEELYKYLKGNWDNGLQVFFEPELGVPKEKGHNRFHIALSEIKSNGFAPLSLRIEYSDGSEKENVLRSRIWEIVPNFATNKIEIKQFEPKVAANYSNISKSEFSYLEGCNLELTKIASGFIGTIDSNKCKAKNKNHEIISIGETHEISQNYWHISDYAKNEHGQIIFTTKDKGPNIYKKANFFNCWVSAYNGTDYKTKSNLKVHDQGGEASLKFGQKTVRIRLRDVVWPLGNNRPSLTLYLLLGAEDYSDIYTWTDSDANRIALAFGDYQASCTREQ